MAGHDALREAATGLAKPLIQGRPMFFGAYTMDANGLAIEMSVGKGEAKRMETVWIAAPFEVLGLCRDPNGARLGEVAALAR